MTITLEWTNDPPTVPGWYYELFLDAKTGGSYQGCYFIELPSLIKRKNNAYFCGPLPLPARRPKNREWTQRRWEIRKKRIKDTGHAQL